MQSMSVRMRVRRRFCCNSFCHALNLPCTVDCCACTHTLVHAMCIHSRAILYTFVYTSPTCVYKCVYLSHWQLIHIELLFRPQHEIKLLFAPAPARNHNVIPCGGGGVGA